MARLNPDAPTVVPPQLKLVIDTKTQGQISQTVLSYNGALIPTYPTLTNLIDFITAWQAANETLYAACLSPDSTIERYSCAEVGQGTCPTAVVILAPAVAGTAGAHNLPLEMAAVQDLRSSLKGQHGRGRISMPAVPDTFTTPATSPNVLNATGHAAYSDLLASLLLGVTTSMGAWPWTIHTRPTPPATLVTRAVNVVSATTNDLLGTMRRRRPGRGI